MKTVLCVQSRQETNTVLGWLAIPIIRLHMYNICAARCTVQGLGLVVESEKEGSQTGIWVEQSKTPHQQCLHA